MRALQSHILCIVYVTDRASGVGSRDSFRPKERLRKDEGWIAGTQTFFIPIEVQKIDSNEGQVWTFPDRKMEIP